MGSAAEPAVCHPHLGEKGFMHPHRFRGTDVVRSRHGAISSQREEQDVGSMLPPAPPHISARHLLQR